APPVPHRAKRLTPHPPEPEGVAPGSMLPNLDFYEPRTAHGSSLSPAIHAGLLARAGRYRAALEALQIAARLDLDDLTGSAAGGVHVATMGGLWQALVYGLASVRARGRPLVVAPSPRPAADGSAARGGHVATMGGLWQALVYGFAGVRPSGDRLIVDPRLPPQWHALELSLHLRGGALGVPLAP